MKHEFTNEDVRDNEIDEAVSNLLFELAEHLDISDDEGHDSLQISDIVYKDGSLYSYKVTVTTKPYSNETT